MSLVSERPGEGLQRQVCEAFNIAVRRALCGEGLPRVNERFVRVTKTPEGIRIMCRSDLMPDSGYSCLIQHVGNRYVDSYSFALKIMSHLPIGLLRMDINPRKQSIYLKEGMGLQLTTKTVERKCTTTVSRGKIVVDFTKL